MAVNAFKDKKPKEGKINRTAYDLSFQNNLTLRFGRLTPIMCKEVIPGDGVRIKPDFGLNFQPMVFPVQTRIFAKLYFFYVRNRALFPDFKEFITHTPDNNAEVPYINWPESQVSLVHGSLADYLGIPTDNESMTTVSPLSFNSNILPSFDIGDGLLYFPRVFNSESGRNIYSYSEDSVTHAISYTLNLLSNPFDFEPSVIDNATRISLGNFLAGLVTPGTSNVIDNVLLNIPFSFQNLNLNNILTEASEIRIRLHFSGMSYSGGLVEGGDYCLTAQFADGTFQVFRANGWFVNGDSSSIVVGLTIQREIFERCQRTDFLGFTLMWFDRPNINAGPLLVDSFRNAIYPQDPSFSQASDISELYVFSRTSSAVSWDDAVPADWLDMSVSNNPMYSGDLKISALPFRAYESIYNAYFRNQNVDRFMINGAPKYNQFVTTLEGGADNTPYDFFNVNWERDFLTTCLPQPQQGDAPLVGVTGTGQFVFQNEDGTTSTVTPTIGVDGNLTGISAYSEDVPESALSRVMQFVTAGMSINDFRNVNSLQRYLEENMLHGYRYRDLMKAHYGEDIHYNELDMPEYIGGISRIVNMDKVLNNNAAGGPLGEFAGLASMFSAKENSPTISCHCDEHGFIIGLACVMPVPVYSQVLPKFFLKHHFLDYYNPKFANIGYQPVSYSEITPNEKFARDGVDGLSDTFGYQRPWYDYLGSVDEAHGLFRYELENYVLRRKFAAPPELSNAFISLNDDSLNNVFASDEQKDKILGKIFLDITMKRRIPRFNIPRLE